MKINICMINVNTEEYALCYSQISPDDRLLMAEICFRK